jgi:hypothetical protein
MGKSLVDLNPGPLIPMRPRSRKAICLSISLGVKHVSKDI